MTQPPYGKTILLGIGGGIAAYKCYDLVRRLKEAGAEIHVLLTASAQQFVTPLTLQTLSGHPIHTNLFDLHEEGTIGHTTLASRADLVLIAPATANLIARFFAGMCDDIVTAVVCATKAPVMLAPAMNVHMWDNRITQRNIHGLKELGFHVIEPAEGKLACGDEGMGRLPEPEEIVREVTNFFNKK